MIFSESIIPEFKEEVDYMVRALLGKEDDEYLELRDYDVLRDVIITIGNAAATLRQGEIRLKDSGGVIRVMLPDSAMRKGISYE